MTDDTAACMDLDHHEERCPGCGSNRLWESCCFDHSEWSCGGCGATIDSRVVSPDFVHREDVACDAKSA